jgi:hypothetical protein
MSGNKSKPRKGRKEQDHPVIADVKRHIASVPREVWDRVDLYILCLGRWIE